jgi:hypothetical protein
MQHPFTQSEDSNPYYWKLIETLVLLPKNNISLFVSLRGYNCRLPTLIIESRSSVGPGNTSIKVMTSASVKVYYFERNTNHVSWPPISSIVLKPSVVQVM